MGTKYHGRKGKLYMSTALAGAATRIADLTTWSLNITRDIAEVTSLGDDFKSFVGGMRGGTVKAQGFWSTDADIPYDAFDSDGLVYVYLYPSENAALDFWCGFVWPTGVSAEVSSSAAAAMSLDATFDGTIGRSG